MMRIALDYDATYTLDPGFWEEFEEIAGRNGHDVRIVTIRDDRYDRTPDLIELERYFKVIYTRGVAKKWFVSHFVPDFHPVDVWIDDRPETILANSETTPEDLAAWRAQRNAESAR